MLRLGRSINTATLLLCNGAHTYKVLQETFIVMNTSVFY